jgi:hypothetical protein
MIGGIFGYPAENSCYELSDEEIDGRINLVLKIFRDRLYRGLFPKYDIWTHTITNYEGNIQKLGDIVLTGKNRKPLIADREKICKVIITEDILLFDKEFYYNTFGAEAKRIADEIRYENLCLGGWERFICGVVSEIARNNKTHGVVIVIHCIYGLELR